MLLSSPEKPVSVVDKNGFMQERFYAWVVAVTDAINGVAPLTGSGGPEGIQVASPGRWYVDKSAASGAGIYFKETGNGSTGWVQRS